MAADKTLIDAYSRYYQAMGTADIMTNPMLQLQSSLVTIGQEWMKKKEKAKQDSKVYLDRTHRIMEKMTGLDLLSTDARTQVTQNIYQWVTTGGEALKRGDMQTYSENFGYIQNQVRQGKALADLATTHHNNQKDNLYSKGAPTTPLDFIFNENPEYKFTIKGDSNWDFLTSKGDSTLKNYSINALGENLILRDKMGKVHLQNWIDGEIKRAYTQESSEFRENYWNPILNELVANDSQLVSAWNDNEYGFINPVTGAAESLKERWMRQNPGKSPNWADIETRGDTNNPSKTDEYWEGGWNSDQLRAYILGELKSYTKGEFLDGTEKLRQTSSVMEGYTDNAGINKIIEGYKNGFKEEVNLIHGEKIMPNPVLDEADGKLKYEIRKDGELVAMIDPTNTKQMEGLLLRQTQNKTSTNNQIHGLDWDNIAFGGFGGSELTSEQTNKISALFGPNAKEAHAASTLKAMFPTLKDKISEADMLSPSKIEVGGKVFNVRDENHLSALIKKLNEMISGTTTTAAFDPRTAYKKP